MNKKDKEWIMGAREWMNPGKTRPVRISFGENDITITNRLEVFKYKSGDFRVTHQAAANWWSLFSCMVSVVARILFSEHQR